MESPCRHPCTLSGSLETRDGLHVRDGEQATGIEPGNASLGSGDRSCGMDQGSFARARGSGPSSRGEPPPWWPPPELLLLATPPARLRPLPLPSS